VLNQVSPTGAVGGAICQQLTDPVELVIAGKDRPGLLLAGLAVLLPGDLGIVLDGVVQAGWSQDSRPEVAGLDSVGVGGLPAWSS